MPASSHKLAEALATRLNKVVPRPFRVAARGQQLYVYAGDFVDSIKSLDIVDDETRDRRERVETAVLAVINSLQDDISEHLQSPWPSEDGHTMALANARSDATNVMLWYGDPQSPTLTFAPIRIDEICP